MADAHAPGDSNAPTVLLATTPDGKELFLFRRPNCSVRMIGYKGGEVIKELEGGYSSVAAAIHEALSYVAKLEEETKVVAAKRAAAVAKAMATKKANQKVKA